MTDVPDWTTAASGDSRLVTQGTANASPTNVPVTLVGTDQCLIVLATSGAAPTFYVTAVGHTSGITYDNVQQNAATPPLPVIIPVAGALDSQIDLTFTAGGTPYNYFVLASSDFQWWASAYNLDVLANVFANLPVVPRAPHETPVSVVTGNATPVAWVPAPPGGQVVRVRNCSWVNTVTAATNVTITGATSGLTYAAFTLAASGTNSATPALEIVANEGLKIAQSAATGNVRHSCTYSTFQDVSG